MYIDDHSYIANGKPYRRVLLRHSYREGGKVKQKNIANITSCSEQEIQAIKFALKNKDNADFLRQMASAETSYWKKAGSVILLYQVIKELGIDQILGKSNQANYVFWQIMSRLIQPSSQLASVRLAQQHCGCELIGIDEINELNLYDSLVWLHDNKDSIEKRLFVQRHKNHQSDCATLFLYDVSSSYLEGKHNELATWGYNRDKKKGKLQIVYGLLTDEQGYPLSVEAFEGNTKDTATVATQIKKIKDKFGCKRVVFVGDKGMIKQAEIDHLQEEGLNYITTITKPQISSLIREGTFQLELFTNDLIEVIDKEQSVRYVLRKNEYRAAEMAENRKDKIEALKERVDNSNTYLQDHPKAALATQKKNIDAFISKLKMTTYAGLSGTEEDHKLVLVINEKALEEIAKLDGCYAMKTDLMDSKETPKEEVHKHYKALAEVEWAFRTQKSQLKIRPVFFRKAHRTRGHLMVCMFAYMIEKYLREKWKGLDITVMEGIAKLGTIVGLKTNFGKEKEVIWIGKPDEQSKELLDKAGVTLPKFLPAKETIVVTKSFLQNNRK